MVNKSPKDWVVALPNGLSMAHINGGVTVLTTYSLGGLSKKGAVRLPGAGKLPMEHHHFE